MEQFELLEIRIGQEVLYARPVAWSDEDPYKEGTKATGYETTCPSCSQMLLFNIDQVKGEPDHRWVACTICGAGTEPGDTNDEKDDDPEDGIVINHDTQDGVSSKDIKHLRPERSDSDTDSDTKLANDDCPFQDPVEAGELKLS